MRVSYVIALLSLMGVAFAGVEDVMILGKDNFTETITGDKPVLVKFYAPWCGHCKSMKEDYEAAAEELKGKAILAEVDATIETDLAEKFEVQGFPTLKLFQGGEVLMDYSGGRDKSSMVAFIESSLLPPVVEMDEEALKKAMTEDAALFAFVLPAGVTKPEESDVAESYKEFETIARKLRPELTDKASFGVADETAMKVFSGKATAKPGQVITKTFGADELAIWNAVDVSEKLETSALLAAVPLFDELSRDNANLYVPHPCVILFAEPGNEAHDKFKEVMTAASAKLAGNGKLLFAWIDTKVLGRFRDQIGVTGEPGVAIIEFEGLVKYIFNPEDEFTADTVAAWAQSYIDGKLTPNLKSAPVPESNDGPVTVVVGSTWTDIVMAEDKDVLMEQYAPWCGHCKKLEPIYDELATKLSGVQSIVIAKMDATENDAPAPHSAQGFPTITFFPSGKDAKPIPYEGGRTVDDMLSFLQENAGIKFEIPEVKAEVEADDGVKADL